MTKVLVVDDDPVARRMVADLLESQGYTVSVATDWVTLSHAFLDDNFELVVLDVMLPGIDGDRLVMDIHALASPPPGVVLHSTLSTEELRRKAEQSGAEGFVSKSSSNEALLMALQTCLARCRSERAPAASAPAPMDHQSAARTRSPAPPDPTGPQATRQSASVPPARGPGVWLPRLLLIDDSATRRKKLEMLFAVEGFEVATCPDGRSALEHVRTTRRERQPEMIVCDVLMPGMDGYEVAERLMDLPDHAETPIILYSASPEEARLADDDPRARRFAEQAHLRGVTPVDRLLRAVNRRVETLRNLRRLRMAREGLDAES